MVPGYDWGSARMCAITHTVHTGGGLVMKRTTKGRNFGLRWIDEGRLEDLDFADDIAVLEDTQEGMKDFIYKMH